MIEKFAYNALNERLQEKIWICNINEMDITKMFKSCFWRDVLIAWSHINHELPVTYADISNQIIWYNSYIRIDGKPCYFVKSAKEGLYYVKQLYQLSGEQMPCEIMCQMFSLTVMQWNGLITALPIEWKRCMQTQPNQTHDDKYCSKYDNLCSKQKPTKYYYQMRIQKENCIAQLNDKWKKQIEIEITREDLFEGFRDIYSVTNQAKYRSFQYKMLHRTVFLNDRLFRWKIKQDNLCTWCRNYKETLFHFFWQCECTQKVWKWMEMFLNKISPNATCNITYKNVILNKVSNQTNHIFNFIVFITKQFLYAKRCLGEKVNINELQKKIFNIRHYEKYQAVKNGKMCQHIIKWCIIENEHIVYNGTGFEKEYVRNYIEQYITNDM